MKIIICYRHYGVNSALRVARLMCHSDQLHYTESNFVWCVMTSRVTAKLRANLIISSICALLLEWIEREQAVLR